VIIVKNNCPNCNYPESHDYIRGYQICINCGVAFLKGYTEENLAKYYSSGEYRAKYKQPNEVAHQTRRAVKPISILTL
jgi:transcription initiation factor TFIIIB Brf1 subunit/transcription initiation factor TFIIB